MALDVHIVKRGVRYPTKSSGFGFGDEHEAIYQFISSNASAYPQLAKMEDYYDDVSYEGQDLKDLVAELLQVVEQFPAGSKDSAAAAGLQRFLDLATQASDEDKTLLLFAD
jgi:hypothetical protein